MNWELLQWLGKTWRAATLWPFLNILLFTDLIPRNPCRKMLTNHLLSVPLGPHLGGVCNVVVPAWFEESLCSRSYHPLSVALGDRHAVEPGVSVITTHAAFLCCLWIKDCFLLRKFRWMICSIELRHQGFKGNGKDNPGLFKGRSYVTDKTSENIAFDHWTPSFTLQFPRMSSSQLWSASLFFVAQSL